VTDHPQLTLFARSTSKSQSDEANSLHSNELETSSIDPAASTQGDATSTTPHPPVRASFKPGGAAGAGTSRRGASNTGASAPQLTMQTCTVPSMVDRMLTVPRPRTRGECLAEARPCPWTACRHHVLFEIATPKKETGRIRATSIRLNRPSRERTKLGRRPGLRSSAAAHLVRQWIDDAVEALSLMLYTCSLDVVDDFPGGAPDDVIAQVLGVHEQLIDQEWRAYLKKLHAGLVEAGVVDE
jgi:hypothetical protein